MVKAGPGEDFGLQTARGLVKARVLVAPWYTFFGVGFRV